MEHPDDLSFDMRSCPHCGTTITKAARTCRACGGAVEPLWRGDDGETDPVQRMILPVGRPASAIAAGYLGLFSVLPFFGVAAVIVSLFALRTLKRRPHLSGRGRAIFGLLMGSIFTLLYAIPLVLLLLNAIDVAQGRRPRF